jgi:heme o synthase
MWSNGDETGAKTGGLSLFFSALLIPLMLVPAATGFAGHWFTSSGMLLTMALCALAWRFLRTRTRSDARKLFFGTLLYLPAALALLLIFAR